MARPKYYATVQIRVHVKVDPVSENPTFGELSDAARSKVSEVMGQITRTFGGVSYSEQQLTRIECDLETGGGS